MYGTIYIIKKKRLKLSQLYKQKPLYMYLFIDDYETKEKLRKFN